MGFVTVNQEEAIFSHQKFYEDDFEVVLMARSGFYDFFPYSMVYGVSDIGSWGGLISTDGKKIVVTKSKYTDLAKIKKSFEFEVSDIDDVEFNLLKAHFKLNKEISGLTMPNIHAFIKLCTLGMCIFLYPFLSKKVLQIRIDNQFKNKDAFQDLLKK